MSLLRVMYEFMQTSCKKSSKHRSVVYFVNTILLWYAATFQWQHSFPDKCSNIDIDAEMLQLTYIIPRYRAAEGSVWDITNILAWQIMHNQWNIHFFQIFTYCAFLLPLSSSDSLGDILGKCCLFINMHFMYPNI